MPSLSASTIGKVQLLTSAERFSVFVVDDSMFERNRSKMVALLSQFKDHATSLYYKGFRMLTLGCSDGHTFIPIDFSLLASSKSQVNGIMEGIDKRTSGYKRRKAALLPAPEVISAMIDRAISSGVQASYVLIDSWFIHAPLIQAILDRGLDVFDMVKADKKRQKRMACNFVYRSLDFRRRHDQDLRNSVGH